MTKEQVWKEVARFKPTKGSREHVVEWNSHWGYRCSCPDFFWRHASRGTICKHIRKVMDKELEEERRQEIKYQD